MEINHSCFRFLKVIFIGLVLVVAGQAQTFISPAGDISIPDGTNAPLCNSPGAYVCKNVVVSGLSNYSVLRSAAVVLIDHENVGSMDVEILGPGGSPTFMPFSRTGSVSPTDCGDTTDAEGDYTFQDNVVGNWWNTAAVLNFNDIMPSGTYFPSVAGGGPSPPAGDPNNTMSQTFSGVNNGTWQVCVRDWGDNGGARLQLARLTFVTVTAAPVSVGGRVMTGGGNGIRNALVTLSGGNLPEPLVTQTSTFGYYSFPEVPVGGTYIVTVQSKRYIFSNPSQVLEVQDNIGDADFIAEGK